MWTEFQWRNYRIRIFKSEITASIWINGRYRFLVLREDLYWTIKQHCQ